MRNPEKSALRKQFRRARAQMSADERNTATETINRLLKPYIKKRTENRRVLADGQGIAIGRLCPCRTKTRRKTLPALYRTAHAADVVHPLPCRRRQTRTQTRPRQIARPPIHRQKNPRPPTQPIAGPHRRHRQTRYRLGQAGGYYDATLSAMKYRLQTQTLGVGFGCQLTDTLPTEPHDIPLNDFVSELGVLKFRRRR